MMTSLSAITNFYGNVTSWLTMEEFKAKVLWMGPIVIISLISKAHATKGVAIRRVYLHSADVIEIFTIYYLQHFRFIC